ncbi:hypothetical protein LTR53_016001 [Teratosphaeriaceae sp. CCFEE 6253]|nr:hypothetical protein LTR53_016001 [Teratosphaeriaceae sp. CCFEE 6253]
MATLQSLPVELLAQICEDLGGAELRRGRGSSARLSLFRAWYAAARPLLLSGLDLAQIAIYGHNVNQLVAGEYSNDREHGKRALMHVNTRALLLRFWGYEWDKRLAAEYEAALRSDGDDREAGILGMKGRTLDPDAQSIPSSSASSSLRAWPSTTLAPALDELFGDLRHFTALQTVRLEASAYPHTPGPRAYLQLPLLQTLLRNLPVLHSLTELTLDTAGTSLACPVPPARYEIADGSPLDYADPAEHLCPDLAAILPRIRTVRLRMRRICADVFPPATAGSSSTTPTPAPLAPEQVKARSLILKLHLPTYGPQRAGPCCERGPSNDEGRAHLADLLRAARGYLEFLASLRHPVASSPPQHYLTLDGESTASRPSLLVMDALDMHTLCPPEEFFVYEDDGAVPCWFEEREDLVPLHW